jgi:integrase
MAGSRPLTSREERLLLRHIRRINARDRALISAQMFLGFRISEILALTVGHVLHHGQIRERVALPPRFLKGKRGSTRTVPIGPELRRALEHYLFRRHPLDSAAPLFVSPRHGAGGAPRPICRWMAQKIIKRALSAIAEDPQGLSSHSLRKSWGLRLYEASGRDLLVVRDGLGHRSVAVTQIYLPIHADRVEACMRATDWTHRNPRRRRDDLAAKSPLRRLGVRGFARTVPVFGVVGNGGRGDAAKRRGDFDMRDRTHPF